MRYRQYHFIGIGGIGMSGIAHLLLEEGSAVSGSDVKETKSTEALVKMGAKVFIGHAPGNIAGADVVVYSSAIRPDNPEFCAAMHAHIPVLKRAQALAELMKDKTVITVTGSHGKTTTTSLAAYLLLEAGFSPSMAIGGILKNIGHNASRGKGDYFIAEADESDGSFLYYDPEYSIVTNIDYEHLDYYKNFDNALAAYREYMGKTAPSGCLFCCRDDANIMRLIQGIQKKCVLFGLTPEADIYPERIQFNGLSSDFDCLYRGKLLRRLHLELGGLHNISNALSVVGLGLELNIPLDTIEKACAGYKGAGRRLDIKYRSQDIVVLDDYAHHPTEIRATLSAVCHLGASRVIAVFQPHRFSRTQLLLEEFGKCFLQADYVVLTDIYPASESPIPGVTAEAICDKIKANFPEKKVDVLPKEKIAEHVARLIKPHDAVLMLGAGDIVKVSDELVHRLKN